MKMNIEPSKTYATEANAIRAIEKANLPEKWRYMIVWNEAGRCYPLFVGIEALYVAHIGFPVVA